MGSDDGDIHDRVIRIEGKLDTLAQTIAFGDNTAAQLLTFLTDRLERAEREIRTRAETERALNQATHVDLARRVSDTEVDDADHVRRLSALENWQSKVIGIAIGCSALTGGVAGLIARTVAVSHGH